MPKKTRKEKVLAQQRRTSSYTPPVSSGHIPSGDHIISTSYQFRATHVDKVQEIKQEDMMELTAIKRDLTKTLTLAIIAIGVEFYLYWLLQVK
jgi:hypothetical protein